MLSHFGVSLQKRKEEELLAHFFAPKLWRIKNTWGQEGLIQTKKTVSKKEKEMKLV